MAKPAEIKTKQNEASVADFLQAIADETKRKDSEVILGLMTEITGEEPKMWGAAMIGFGKLRYKSPTSGREVDWFKIGFSPRKTNLSLSLTINIQKHTPILEKLGKHKTGMGCLYINKLADVDQQVLKQLMIAAFNEERNTVEV